VRRRFSQSAGGFAQRVFDQTRHFLGSAFNSLIQIGTLVFQRQGLVAFQTHFQGALDTFFGAFLATVFIAHMCFYPGNLAAKACQSRLDGAAGPLSHGFGAFNVVICVKLNLHLFLLMNATTLVIGNHSQPYSSVS